MPAQAERRADAGAQATAVRRVAVPFGQRLASSSTYDAEARTVEVVIATETPVRMPGWAIGIDADYYLEVLDCSPGAVDFGQVAAGNCPLLDAHNRWSLDDRLGVVRDGRCENKQVIITTAFGQSDAAKALEADVAAGTAPKASAGYRRNQMVFERFEGDVPVYRVTSWTLTEASFVPIAADQNAGVRSEAVQTPCIITERAMPLEDNAAAGAADETNIDTTTNANGTRSGGEGDGQRQQQQAGKSRFSASAALMLVEQARAFGDTVVTRANELIEQNEKGEISVDAARAEMLKTAAEAQRAGTKPGGNGGSRIEFGADERSKWMRGAENSIIVRAGLTDMVRAAAQVRGEKIDLDPGEFRGVRNAELARMALEHAGERVSSYDREQIVLQAIGNRASMQTTSDFPKLLENVLHKTLQAAYQTTPDTWRRFCGVGSIVDFRPHPRYLRGTFGALDDVTEDGEYKNKAIPDAAKESIQGKRKGNIVGLTREAIVNDDMSAFSFVTVDLARAAKLSIEKDVYALLALNSGAGPTMNDGNPLFHTSHANIATTSAAPSVNSIDAMRILMASQKDVSGNEVLDITPSIWLGPLALGGAVRVVNNSEYDPDTANKLQRFNIAKGIFKDIVDTARLSGTPWYVFADPTVAPAIEVVFLNGQQEPYTESREGWRTDGIEWKIRHEYGVGAVNYRSAAMNAGA